MLYTSKGDDGTTNFFNSSSEERVSKKSFRAEALGTLDEINSLLGVCKLKAKENNLVIKTRNSESIESVVLNMQQILFIVQAEVAGANKTVSEEKVKYCEDIINDIEKEMPPVTSFFVSGGTELGAFFDFSRTVSRRAERKIIAGIEANEITVGIYTRKFLNRLSSLLYACARYANFSKGIVEEKPHYI